MVDYRYFKESEVLNMNKEILDFTVAKTKEILGSHTCCSELKASAQSWLDAVGTDQEASETQKYLAELEADIMPIDTLINFAESDAGAQVFGDHAKEVAAHGREIKSAGAAYCDCPACAAAEAILDKKEDLLK